MTWRQTACIRPKISRSLTQRRFRFNTKECPQRSVARISTSSQSSLPSPEYDRHYPESGGKCLPVTRESPTSSGYRTVADLAQPDTLPSHVAQHSRLKYNPLSLSFNLLYFTHMEARSRRQELGRNITTDLK